MLAFLILMGLYLVFLVLAGLVQALVLLQADRRRVAAGGRRRAAGAGLGTCGPMVRAGSRASSQDLDDAGCPAAAPPSTWAQRPEEQPGQPWASGPHFKQ